MDAPEIKLSDDAIEYFRQNARYGSWDGEDVAQINGWSGFAFVLGSDGAPLPYPEQYVAGHQCAYLRAISNGGAAVRIMEEVAPSKAVEWNGLLVYDYGDPAACEAADRIGDALAGYPLLDEEDFSELERANAAQVLVECYDVPQDIAADVVSALSSDGQSLCTDCNRWDLDKVTAILEHRQCVECGKWLATTCDEPLHYDCAESYTEGECECIFVMVDGYRHGNHTVTLSDVRETMRGCEHCYSIVHPYGKSVG